VERNLHFRQHSAKYGTILYSDRLRNVKSTSNTLSTVMCKDCSVGSMDCQYEIIGKRWFYSSANSQRKVLSSSAAMNLPSIKQIEQFLSSKGIRFEQGHTSIVVACSSCSRTREKEGKKPEMSMYINKTTGSHFCKNCGRSGSWRQFKVILFIVFVIVAIVVFSSAAVIFVISCCHTHCSH
jgi:hypothetical protein